MTNIDPALIGILGLITFLFLVMIRVPIGIGMGCIGFLGIAVLNGTKSALNALYTLPYSTMSSWLFAVIPMFILMGTIAFYAGFTRDGYNCVYKWLGRFPGGLAIATLVGAAGFGACSGSSIAATAALGRLSLPEMDRFGYDKRLAAGVVGMGGTLSALIPPSILLVLYGAITEQSVGKLLIAGILPGILSLFFFAMIVFVWALFKPEHAPKGEIFSWKEKIVSLKYASGILVLFISVTGGIYSGIFTPSEAGAVGAVIILLMALVMRRLTWSVFNETVVETLKTVSSIFLIVLGAYIFIQFMALTRLPVVFGEWILALHIHKSIIIMGVILMYLIMGCFLDALGLILLTVPFISPAIFALGYSPIWFGVLVVKLVEIGLLTPPVGIQAYVLKGVAPDLTLKTIFLGFIPFFVADIFLVIGLMVVFPQIVTYLPNLMK